MPPLILDLTEQDAQVAALKQWLISQEIHEAYWTPICMNLAGQDIARTANGRPTSALNLLEAATMMLVSSTQRFFRNG
jgi:hypothetical protein